MPDEGSGPGRFAQAWTRFRGWPTWLQAVAWVILGVVVLSVFTTDEGKETAVQSQPTTSTTEGTTTTAREPEVTTTTTTQPEPESPQQHRDSRLACVHFRNVVGDADVLSDEELRDKIKEVHGDAVIATPGVEAAAREALAAITADDVEAFGVAIRRLSDECAAAGW